MSENLFFIRITASTKTDISIRIHSQHEVKTQTYLFAH